MWLLMLITWAFVPPPLTFSFPQGSAAQEPIVRSARSMLDSSTYLLETARSLVLNPKDPPTWSILAGHSRTVSDSIKSLITSIRLVVIQPTAASVSAGLSWIEVYNSLLTVGQKMENVPEARGLILGHLFSKAINWHITFYLQRFPLACNRLMNIIEERWDDELRCICNAFYQRKCPAPPLLSLTSSSSNHMHTLFSQQLRPQAQAAFKERIFGPLFFSEIHLIALYIASIQ